MRICSLVPGATEVVAALGCQDNLIGISHECDFPPSVAQLPVVVRPRIESHHLSSAEIDQQVGALVAAETGLYELDEMRLLSARPDLIIAQALCDVCAITPSQLEQVVHALSPPPRMLTLSPGRLDDILRDIERIGTAIGREEAGIQLSAALRSRLDTVQAIVGAQATRPRVACIEWLSPLYTAGHWVPDMVTIAGGIDVLAQPGTASRKLDGDTFAASDPDVIVLMPCGFTVSRTKAELAGITGHPQWPHLPAVQRGEVYQVDALSYFSRPGPRLIDGVEQLAAILHPACYSSPLPAPVERFGAQATHLH